MWSRKAVLGAFLALLALYSWLWYTTAVDSAAEGIKRGIHLYHQQCFQIGGYIWNEEGHVVHCQPVITIPREEMEDMRKKDALTS